ncbi:MAG: hypothetical protein KBC17_00630 [Candidatus Pacebacteria bacterium]|nr:hypothetical protein [Candidatus Paceibacterota bacterium]
MKHLSKGQFWGLVIFFTVLVLAIGTFFVPLNIALGFIGVMLWLSLCYLTIIVHPLLKSRE